MNVFLTGATGFVGRAVVQRLLRDGHALTAWVRDPARARGRLGPGVRLVPVDDATGLAAALAGADAVVNLAGEPVLGGRWTAARKRRLRESRVGLTRRLVRALAAASPRPRVLVSASAVGWYGARPGPPADETAAPGDDFLARLCVDWEAAAAAAEPLGVRVARLRIGVVLGAEGGALRSALPLFRAGLGARVGRGDGAVPWVHLHDVVETIRLALTDARFAGPVNVVAPETVTQRRFVAALAGAVGRRARLVVPAAAARLALGEAAQAVLGGRAVRPAVLEDLGFRFAHPRLEEALAELLDARKAPLLDRAPAGASPVPGRRAVHRLRQHTVLQADPAEVFAFFSQAANLGLITPAWTEFRILSEPDDMRSGARIAYRLRIGPVPLRWRSTIERWQPGAGFVDRQDHGPYRLWWHEHRFTAEGGRIRMDDTVLYTLPFGPLGRLVHRLAVAGTLRRIFAYRAEAVALRFGGRPASEAP